MQQRYLEVWEPKGAVRIRNLEDFMRQIRKITKPRARPVPEKNRFLFRGTSDSAWDLLPSLPRSVGSGLKKPKTKLDRPWLTPELLYHIEKESFQQFKMKARLYIAPEFLPKDDSVVGWWQLMQHHGAKTRLLDWTSSPFLAAYFAVAENATKDGAIWAVEHGAHSDRMGERHSEQFKKHGNEIRRELQLCQFLPSTKHSRQLVDSLVFLPCGTPNQRMSAQRGWFSVTSMIDTDHGEAIARAFDDPKHQHRWWCQRFIIERKAKSEILRDLWDMNITGETIFCGLDGLGRAMSELTDLLAPSVYCDFRLEEGLLSAERRSRRNGRNPARSRQTT